MSKIKRSDFPYLYETHLHTSEGSACGKCPGAEMARACKEAGYDGIFVTDHAWGGNTAVDRSLPWREWVELFALGYRHAKEWGDENGLKVWYGYESGFHGTEFLIYGITPEWMADHPELHDATIPEQREIIHSGGGIVVQAHPYREEFYIPEVRLYPEHSDGIEGVNATHSSPKSMSHKSDVWNPQAIELARANNKPMTAGSDVHSTNIFGGGICTARPLQDPQDFISLIMGDEMYLLTDGAQDYDRHGNKL
ncbi:MAG: PHP domain-containing protein [Lachnospiraceae bacterium]|nr:PHP domain-containing protein [Lachnospiraceae bacterium]